MFFFLVVLLAEVVLQICQDLFISPVDFLDNLDQKVIADLIVELVDLGVGIILAFMVHLKEGESDVGMFLNIVSKHAELSAADVEFVRNGGKLGGKE